jgi:chemosensory pili system protein ChpA (sensor histidine kinase/response regulator)
MATVLLADDDPVIRRLLIYVLERDGHNALVATDGSEAIASLEENPIDLLLLDLNMPEADGLAVLKHARAQPRYHDLPVVMLTASGQNRDEAAAWAAGVNQFLTKPFSSRELRETLERLLV